MCDIIWAGTILNIRFVMGLGLSHKRRHVQTLNSAPAYAPIDTGAPVKAAWDSGPRYMSMISSGGAGNAAARSIVLEAVAKPRMGHNRVISRMK